MTEPLVRGYFGPKGRGKTTAALADLKRQRRRLVYDLKGAAAQHELAAHDAEIIHDPVQLWQRLVAAGDDQAFVVCWRGFRDDPAGAFEHANRCAWLLGNLALLWDEADLLTAGQLPPASYAARIAHMSRGKGIALGFTARRPALVPRTLTANADELAMFRAVEPRDVRYLAEFTGLALPDLRAQLAELPDFHALAWRDGAPLDRRRPAA